ncbi:MULTISPECIES: hypothetical protein [Parafrankia]|nr:MULTISPECIES: hypothetical protein [Parafrankia]MBE3201893.1 hypothetical protein [Parafrankia sp. CH37]
MVVVPAAPPLWAPYVGTATGTAIDEDVRMSAVCESSRRTWLARGAFEL